MKKQHTIMYNHNLQPTILYIFKQAPTEFSQSETQYLYISRFNRKRMGKKRKKQNQSIYTNTGTSLIKRRSTHRRSQDHVVRISGMVGEGAPRTLPPTSGKFSCPGNGFTLPSASTSTGYLRR